MYSSHLAVMPAGDDFTGAVLNDHRRSGLRLVMYGSNWSTT